MGHWPLVAEGAAPTHLLWNSQELVDLLTTYSGTVISYFSGHYHPGGYKEVKGVHFLTFKGILEAPSDSNCFGIVHIFEDRVEVKGFGTEPSRTLKM